MGAQPKRHSENIVDLRRVQARCEMGGEDSVEDMEGVHVLGAVKRGVTYDIAR